MSSGRRFCRDCSAAIELPTAVLCAECRYAKRRKVCRENRIKYVWTPATDAVLRERYQPQVRGRVAELAKELGFPGWLVRRRAALLGLTREAKARAWTPAEVAFITQHASHRTAAWIARHMPGGRRTLASVVLKLRRLGISQHVSDGYTARQVGVGFGVDSHCVGRWVRAGLLQGERRAQRQELRAMSRPQQSPWRISASNLLAFALEHPEAYDFAKVDQEFFLSLVRLRLGPPACSACERPIAGEPVVDQRDGERHLLCVDCAEFLAGERREFAGGAA